MQPPLWWLFLCDEKIREQYTILHYIVPCILIFDKLHDRLGLKWPKVA